MSRQLDQGINEEYFVGFLFVLEQDLHYPQNQGLVDSQVLDEVLGIFGCILSARDGLMGGHLVVHAALVDWYLSSYVWLFLLKKPSTTVISRAYACLVYRNSI